MTIDRIDITAQLFALQDKAYADFQSKLLPTVKRETVIGVRTPDLRKMAKQICKTPAAQEREPSARVYSVGREGFRNVY